MLLFSSLFPSVECYKSFSNFLLIADFFLLLLSLFRIDSNFGLSCNRFHMICLMYFILSCVLSDLYNDNNPYLVALIVLLGTYYLLRDRYTRYVNKIHTRTKKSIVTFRRRSLFHPS
jgi:hypothetical protein